MDKWIKIDTNVARKLLVLAESASWSINDDKSIEEISKQLATSDLIEKFREQLNYDIKKLSETIKQLYGADMPSTVAFLDLWSKINKVTLRQFDALFNKEE